jgi:hypothetical protein
MESAIVTSSQVESTKPIATRKKFNENHTDAPLTVDVAARATNAEPSTLADQSSAA